MWDEVPRRLTCKHHSLAMILSYEKKELLELIHRGGGLKMGMSTSNRELGSIIGHRTTR